MTCYAKNQIIPSAYFSAIHNVLKGTFILLYFKMCHQKAVLKNRFAVLRYMIGMMRTIFLWYSTFDFMIQFIYANTLWAVGLVIFESDLYNFNHFGNIINFCDNDKNILRYKMLFSLKLSLLYIYLIYMYICIYHSEYANIAVWDPVSVTCFWNH